MLQREAVRKALKNRRATHGHTEKFKRAQEFIESALEGSGECWDELARKFRDDYYDTMDEVVAILKETDDPLILFHLMRQADLKEPAELESVRKLVRDIDPDKHEVSMLGLTGEPTLRAALKKKGGLPQSVRAVLEESSEEVGKTSEFKEAEKKAPTREAEKKAPTREAEKKDATEEEDEKPTGIKPPPKPQRTGGKKRVGDAGAEDDTE